MKYVKLGRSGLSASRLVDVVAQVVQGHGVPCGQVAIAWLSKPMIAAPITRENIWRARAKITSAAAIPRGRQLSESPCDVQRFVQDCRRQSIPIARAWAFYRWGTDPGRSASKLVRARSVTYFTPSDLIELHDITCQSGTMSRSSALPIAC